MASSLSVDRVLRSVMIGAPGADPEMVDRIINGNNPSLRMYSRNVAIRLVRETGIEKLDLQSVLKILKLLKHHFPKDAEIVDLLDQFERRLRHLARQRDHHVVVSPVRDKKFTEMTSILDRLKGRQNMSPNMVAITPKSTSSYLFEDLIREFSPKNKTNLSSLSFHRGVVPLTPLSPRRIVLSESSDESCEGSQSMISRPPSRRSCNISIEDEYDISRNFKLRKWWRKWNRFILSQKSLIEGFRKLAKIISQVKKRKFFNQLQIYLEWKTEEMEQQRIRLQRLDNAISLRQLVEFWDNWRSQFQEQISRRRSRVGGIARMTEVMNAAIDRRYRETFFCIQSFAETRIIRQMERVKGIKIIRKIFRKILNKYFHGFKNFSSNIHLYRYCGVFKLVPIVEKLQRQSLRTSLRVLGRRSHQSFGINRIFSFFHSRNQELCKSALMVLLQHTKRVAMIETTAQRLIQRRQKIALQSLLQNSKIVIMKKSTSILISFVSLLQRKSDILFGQAFRVILASEQTSLLESKLIISETSQKNLSDEIQRLTRELRDVTAKNQRLERDVNERSRNDSNLLCRKIFKEWRLVSKSNMQKKKAARWMGFWCRGQLMERLVLVRNGVGVYNQQRLAALNLSHIARDIIVRNGLKRAWETLSYQPSIRVDTISAIEKMRISTIRIAFNRMRILFAQSRRIKRSIGMLKQNLVRFSFNAIRENYWKMEILLSYAECDRVMETCEAKLDAYDECMRKVRIQSDLKLVRLAVLSWYKQHGEKKEKISRLMRVVGKYHLKTSIHVLKSSRRYRVNVMNMTRIMGEKVLFALLRGLKEMKQNVFDSQFVELKSRHAKQIEEHERVAKELADAATEIEADYHELKLSNGMMKDENRNLEKELQELMERIDRESREKESLIFRMNELKNSELVLREELSDHRRILQDHDQYRRIADQQRMEIERLSSRVGENGKLANSIAFYKNKCMLQTEQISALQHKLRESTSSPVFLSSSMTRRGTNGSGVLFPSPTNLSHDLSSHGRRTSVGTADYTPTGGGDESSKRYRQYRRY